MGITVNFQRKKRNYMSIQIEEAKDNKLVEKTIFVGMPKKRVFESLINFKNMALDTTGNDEESSMQALNRTYELVTEILSNNLNNEKFSAEWVGDTFSIDEIKEIMHSYTSFCKGESVVKN